MKDVLKSLYNPKRQATGAYGNIGGLLGNIGGRYGHLGEDFGYDNAYKPEDHFDLQGHYDVTTYFDPEALLKRF